MYLSGELQRRGRRKRGGSELGRISVRAAAARKGGDGSNHWKITAVYELLGTRTDRQSCGRAWLSTTPATSSASAPCADRGAGLRRGLVLLASSRGSSIRSSRTRTTAPACACIRPSPQGIHGTSGPSPPSVARKSSNPTPLAAAFSPSAIPTTTTKTQPWRSSTRSTTEMRPHCLLCLRAARLQQRRRCRVPY